MVDILVTIPAHNEGETVGKVVSRIKRVLSNEEHLIVVVSDGSTDDTVLAAKEAGAVVYHKWHSGLADTFRYEMALVKTYKPKIVVHIDADGQYLASEIPKLVRGVRQGHDLVLGSRLTGHIEAKPFVKWFFNKLATKIFTLLLKQRIDDVTTGFRAFTPAVAQLPITSRYTYTYEQIVRAAKARYRIGNVPVCFLARDGESRLMRGAGEYLRKALADLWRLHREVNLLR